MSERMYKIYSLRGYDGKLPRGEIKLIKRKTDFIFIFAGLLILTGVLIPWNI
jgi:cobalt/nickel transport system permease protein